MAKARGNKQTSPGSAQKKAPPKKAARKKATSKPRTTKKTAKQRPPAKKQAVDKQSLPKKTSEPTVPALVTPTAAKLAKRQRLPERAAGRPVEILFIGDPRRQEFREAFELLQQSASLLQADNVPAAVRRVGGWSPELIVLTQSSPGEVPPGQLKQLQAAAPAARILLLEGACCEGEGRSGTVPIGIWRVYWHQAAVLLTAGLRRRAAGQAAWWSAEPEVTRLAPAQTRGLGNSAPLPAGDRAAGIGAVCSRDADFADVLREVLLSFGLQTLHVNPAADGQQSAESLLQLPGVRIVLWDCDSGEDLPEFKQSSRHPSAAAVIGLVGALRPEDFGRCAGRANVALLGKPCDLACLEQLITQSLGFLAASA